MSFPNLLTKVPDKDQEQQQQQASKSFLRSRYTTLLAVKKAILGNNFFWNFWYFQYSILDEHTRTISLIHLLYQSQEQQTINISYQVQSYVINYLRYQTLFLMLLQPLLFSAMKLSNVLDVLQYVSYLLDSIKAKESK